MKTTETEPSVYAKLKKLREARGLTVDDLAKKMGENHQKVGRVERGVRSLTVEYLLKASKALETPLESILTQNEAGNNGRHPQANILNEIVILIEKTMPNMTAEHKGKLISDIYEKALDFPENYQSLFVNSVIELIKFVDDSSQK